MRHNAGNGVGIYELALTALKSYFGEMHLLGHPCKKRYPTLSESNNVNSSMILGYVVRASGVRYIQ